MRRSSRPVAVAVAAVMAAPLAPLAAQIGHADSARAAVDHFIALVAGGGADEAFEQASDLFTARIHEADWRAWVYAHGVNLNRAGGRRLLEVTAGSDQPPLRPLRWVRIVSARNRPEGGRLLEQAIAVAEEGVWRVADYLAWPDGEAMVKSLFLPPVPYAISYGGYLAYPGDYLSDFRFRPRKRPPGPRPPPPPPADPPRAIVPRPKVPPGGG